MIKNHHEDCSKVVYVVFGTRPEEYGDEVGWINNIFFDKDKAEFMQKHLTETEDPSCVWKVMDWDTSKPLNIRGDTIDELMAGLKHEKQ